MNLKEQAACIGIEESELKELMVLFLEASDSDLKRLRSALGRRAALEVSQAAHSIKGAAISLGLDQIADLAKAIEHKAHAERLEEIPSSLLPLGEALKEMNNRLNRKSTEEAHGKP